MVCAALHHSDYRNVENLSDLFFLRCLQSTQCRSTSILMSTVHIDWSILIDRWSIDATRRPSTMCGQTFTAWAIDTGTYIMTTYGNLFKFLLVTFWYVLLELTTLYQIFSLRQDYSRFISTVFSPVSFFPNATDKKYPVLYYKDTGYL